VSTDLLLHHLPVGDASFALTYGWLLIHPLALAGILVFERRQLPYWLAVIGIFVLIRNLFLAFTPVGIPQDTLILYTEWPLTLIKGRMFFDNELFFSGHTGTPFLYFLICRKPWWGKYIYLACSIAMATCVLITHNHYTIDVMGAYFITYSIYAMSRRLLQRLDPANGTTD